MYRRGLTCVTCVVVSKCWRLHKFKTDPDLHGAEPANALLTCSVTAASLPVRYADQAALTTPPRLGQCPRKGRSPLPEGVRCEAQVPQARRLWGPCRFPECPPL